MPTQPDPEVIINQIKAAKTEALRGKNSIIAFEKTAIRADTNIEKVKSTIKKKATDLFDTLKKEASAERKSFSETTKESLKEVEKIKGDVKKDAEKFNKIYTSATSPKTGVKARHDQVNTLHKSAAETVGAIDKSHTKVQKTVADVSSLLNTARSNSRSISDINKNAERVNKAINETYQLTLDTTMSGSLIERRDALAKSTKNWAIAFFISLGAIVIGILMVAISIIIAGNDADYIRLIIERFLLVTPLIVIALVISRFYNHERKLYEEYAFKAASAQTIRGYTVLLNEEFSSNSDDPKYLELREQILGFTITVMTGIFDREPLVQSPTLLHFIVGGNLAKFEARIEDKIDTLMKKADISPESK